MPKAKFYAVARGRKPGIYESWQECSEQVNGFSNGCYQGFPTKQQAEAFLREQQPASNKKQKLDDAWDAHIKENYVMQPRTTEASLPPIRPKVEKNSYAAKAAGTEDDTNIPHFLDETEDGIKDRGATPTSAQMRITEVLSRNLDSVLKEADALPKQERCMDGDIPQLGLQKSFFVQGVRLGWPYPAILSPQRQMANHIISGLKRRKHVVLESPTGTGKSAALLCATLAWQRYHAKTDPLVAAGVAKAPTIYYCSRTHSQVAQMVASLQKTPYRPRMAVLGSRERLCIHREINPRNGEPLSNTKVNVNLACQTRVRGTEKMRKTFLRSSPRDADEDPPVEVPNDGGGAAAAAVATQEDQQDDETSKKIHTCPHYRQLTSTRTAKLLQQRFAPSQSVANCCSVGGEKTKMGAHDIEDLVSFGVHPYKQKTAVYRGEDGSLGLVLKEQHGVCRVHEPKDSPHTVQAEDRIVGVNGKAVQGLRQVSAECKSSSLPVVELDVRRGNRAQDDETYSDHSACPYYISRALAKHAEIVFTPYNYLLDPDIRSAMGIDLTDSIVVLDEAHNVEDTLRGAGSGRFGEFELCELISMLEFHTKGYRRRRSEKDEAEIDTQDIAHALLLFLEPVVRYMRNSRVKFQNNGGAKGAEAAIKDWRKFHTADSNEFEIDYFGPTGSGHGGSPVGCKMFFEQLGERCEGGDTLLKYAKELEYRVVGDKSSEDGRKTSNLYDRLVDLIAKVTMAMKSPEHFYIASAARANGSLAFAADGEDAEEPARFGRRSSPKHLPYIQPRTDATPNAPLNPCSHDMCLLRGSVYHGEGLCDGSVPRWEAVLALELLTPSLLVRPIADQCRSLILASGSLAPLGSLCAELGLSAEPRKEQVMTESGLLKIEEKPGRLQVKPQPLEAGHVVNLEKQLCAVSIGCFPDGSPLTVNYSNYKQPGYHKKLGEAIASIVESIPHGGVLVFLPSYSFLKNCVKAWNPSFYSNAHFRRYGEDTEIWDRLVCSKRTIVVEPTGSQAAFEEAKATFSDSINTSGKALLLAVFRGKMSEGISFNDDNARGVICVGLPFPNSHDRTIKAKQLYNDEQRKLRHNTNLLPGMEWYTQQAYRAIAQALGRCIRHAADYGTVILMDSRHCDDGAPINGICRAHKSLPKWMRHQVRNLEMTASRPNYHGNRPIFEGYRGLQRELQSFFVGAKDYTAEVAKKFKDDFNKAQTGAEGNTDPCFDKSSGTWSQSPAPKNKLNTTMSSQL